MLTIDCAGDSELALELEKYLEKHQHHAKAEESFVMLDVPEVDNIIETFLKETNRTAYSMRKIDSANFLLSKEVQIEDFGFLRCEMCGYVVSSEEELLVHRRAHGIQLL